MAIVKNIRKSASKLSKRKSPIDYGAPGAPIDQSRPFYFGFLATSGALISFVLLRALAQTSQIMVFILISLFLASGLNPGVEFFRRRGMSRGASVATIFASVVIFFILFTVIIAPPIVRQTTQLIDNAPQLIDQLTNSKTISNLNDHYGIVDTIQREISKITADGKILVTTFGGVLGVGKTILSGVFAGLTVLILTLYFLVSLPNVIDFGLKMVPATRRPRIAALTNGIINQIGAFVGSQLTVSLLASIVLAIAAAVIGLPSPVALGLIVFIVALIPMVGHYIGAAVTTIVGLTQSLPQGLIMLAFYILYQQVENYVIAPKIMGTQLKIPGVVTIIAAMIGTSLLGFIGAVLAVPVAAAIILILQEVVIPRSEAN